MHFIGISIILRRKRKNYRFLDHRDSTPQPEVPSRYLCSKERIDCSTCPSAVAACMRRNWICQDRCICGNPNDNSCKAELRNRSIVPLSTPYTIRLPASNEVDKKCIRAGLRLEQIFSRCSRKNADSINRPRPIEWTDYNSPLHVRQ